MRMLKTLVGRTVVMPGKNTWYKVGSWDKNTDCYLLKDFYKKAPDLTISRHYLFQLIDIKYSNLLNN